jgi:hypothetical protein
MRQPDENTLTIDTSGIGLRRGRTRSRTVANFGQCRWLSAIGLVVSLSMATLILGAGSSAADIKPTPSFGKIDSSSVKSPLLLSEKIVAAAREASTFLSEALTEIDGKNLVETRDLLEGAAQRLRDVGMTPAARMVLAQLALIRHGISKQPGKFDRQLWSNLQSDIDQYLLGDSNINQSWVQQTFRAARKAAQNGDRNETEIQLKLLFSLIDRDFDVFPLNRAYEDISVVLTTIQYPYLRWEGAKAGTRGALANLHWLLQSGAIPMLQAYYAGIEARDAYAKERTTSWQVLQKAASALGSEKPELAKMAKMLSSKSDWKRAKIADFTDVIRKEIEQSQRVDANKFQSS